MRKPSVTVLVLTYHPQRRALFSTLQSIVLQQDCDYEVIVADDGSGEFFEEEIREFLDSHGIKDYQILAHKENMGTVRNILSGVNHARGRYIKPISPGDFLYNATTLRDTVSFMEKYSAKAAFGKMVFYTYEDKLQVKPLANPLIADIYRADSEHYSHRKAQKQQTVFCDFISGASAVYETETFRQALETVSPAVRYAEDTVFQLFAARHIRIYEMDRYIVWYEHGSGISTQKTNQAFTRVDEDFYRFYGLMGELFPKNPHIRRAKRQWQLRKDGKSRQLLLSKLKMDKILFSLRIRQRKKQLQINGYNEDFFNQCHNF